jgi:signal recognition particle-docking protein FtsY
MNVFKKLSEGLKKTRENLSKRLSALFSGQTLTDEFFDDLEEILITADLGMETSLLIADTLRKRVRERGITDPGVAHEVLIEVMTELISSPDMNPEINTDGNLAVILVIGVNGAGKTTTIGKLAARFVSEGKKVLIAAADTFRAAAIEQVTIWAQRAGADVVSRPEGSDPASVVYDALDRAKKLGTDILIIDTAGRLHNKKHLMDELKKIRRIIAEKTGGNAITGGNASEGDSTTETLLVLDATTGQNAVSQAKLFNEACGVTGIVLTKLDGTAKGGIIIPIVAELKIPVKLVGVGEKLSDLEVFNPRDFIEALFENDTDFDYNYERLDETEESDEETAEVEAAVEDAIAEELTAADVSDDETADEAAETARDDETADESETEETVQPKKKGAFDFLFRPIGRKKDDNNSDE